MPNEPPGGQTFLEKFVSTHYGKQPKWVRTTVFLIFAFLLALSTYRLIDGEYSVRGRILQRADGGYTPARMYEIQLGDRYFGTNSKGFYYLVLGPLEYYSLLATREMNLEINAGGTVFPSQQVRFSPTRQQLDDIKLDAVQEVGWRNPPSEPRRSLFDVLVPPLWAQTLPAGDRLFLRSISLTSNAAVKEARLDLEVDGQSRALVSARTKGESGLIPVVRGDTILLGNDYYFPLADRQPAGSRGQVRLAGEGAPFFQQAIKGGYSENFGVAALPPYGQVLPVKGDRGSAMTLVRMSPYDVTTYNKADVAAVRDRLRMELTKRGFVIAETRSSLGYEGQTNALFGGKSVPFTALQAVLRVAAAHGVKIKTIQYRLNLRSGNPYEIQLGGSARFNGERAIPATRVTAILRATTEQEFMQLIAR